MKFRLKTLSLLATLSASTLVYGDPIPTIQGGKPNPTGIIDLPGAVSAQTPIGDITDHPWQNPNVDGLRIRMGWTDIETADGVFNWVQLDECIANAATVGKFIGLGVVSGLAAPPWLMGGVTFADGSTTLNSAALTSPTANFVTADAGRVIVCSNFPPGTTIRSRTSATSVVMSASATKTKTGNVTFSILARNPGGAQFRNLTAPAMGASAIAAGYTGTPDLPAGLVAWER